MLEAEVKALCDQARAVLMEERNVQPVKCPVTICGDIHSQFYVVDIEGIGWICESGYVNLKELEFHIRTLASVVGRYVAELLAERQNNN